MSANHSYWISDSFAEEDADHENAFHILFGPTSYIKPLDFNPEELEMFEQDSKHMRSTKSKGGIAGPTRPKDTVWRDHGNHFQNILDFIDEMTDENRRMRNNIYITGIKTNTTSTQGNQSAHNSSRQNRRHCDNLEISFCRGDLSEIPGVNRCLEHGDGSRCYCLRKSKCYAVERKTRDVDCLVTKEIESISSGETLPSN